MIKKLLFALLLLIVNFCSGQTKLLSWNLENLGKSKSEASIAFMAAMMNDYDVIAVQEVVAGYGGPQAVARIADALNRKGFKWDYTISEPTSSSGHKSERYAFIWKTAKVQKIGRAWLEKKYHIEIEREPYLCTFKYKNKEFTVASFHAITKNAQPETEIKYFKLIPQKYPTLNLIFAGDFNCPQSNTVFIPLKKMGYPSTLVNKKTSLKMQCKEGNCLASEYDNMFYNSMRIKRIGSGTIHFYKNFATMKEARIVSDHIPIWFDFSLN